MYVVGLRRASVEHSLLGEEGEPKQNNPIQFEMNQIKPKQNRRNAKKRRRKKKLKRQKGPRTSSSELE